MRHRKSGRKLNRTWEHRKAMFRNMARSLLVHEKIRTTEAKAKELRGFMDRLITLTKKDALHARRQAFKILGNHSLVEMLFEEVGPRFKDVSGGYTRVVKLGAPRKGDAAPMAIIELTKTAAVEEEAPKEKAAKPKTKAKAEPTEETKTSTKEETSSKEEESKEEKPEAKPAKKKAAPKKTESKKTTTKKAAPKKTTTKKSTTKKSEPEKKAKTSAKKETGKKETGEKAKTKTSTGKKKEDKSE